MEKRRSLRKVGTIGVGILCLIAMAFGVLFNGVTSALACHMPRWETNETFTISDSGRFNQKYDNIMLVHQTKAGLLAEGFNRIRVQIIITVWEVDDGYQYIFIYKNDSTDGSGLLATQEFEHGPGKKNTTKKEYTFILYINTNDLDHDGFTLRYGASGNFEDTWKNSNPKVCTTGA